MPMTQILFIIFSGAACGFVTLALLAIQESGFKRRRKLLHAMFARERDRRKNAEVMLESLFANPTDELTRESVAHYLSLVGGGR